MKASIRYIIATPNFGICYESSTHGTSTLKFLDAYSDASFVGDTGDRTSTSGIVIPYNESPIYWSSRKPKLATLSTPKAEYITMMVTIQHLHTTQRLLTQVGIMKPHTCTVRTDSQSSHVISRNPHGTKSLKFINLRHNYIYSLLGPDQVTIRYVPSDRQKADIHTEPLQRTVFKKQCNHSNLTVCTRE